MALTTLFIVPTAGTILSDGRLLPGENGQKRLKKVSVLLGHDPNSRLAICGGLHKGARITEAEVHSNWFKDSFPRYAGRVVIVSAISNLTGPDMAGLAVEIEDYELGAGETFTKLATICHPDQGKIANRALQAKLKVDRPIVTEPSTEPKPYPSWQLIALNGASMVDPAWEGLATLPLRKIADSRTDPVQTYVPCPDS